MHANVVLEHDKRYASDGGMQGTVDSSRHDDRDFLDVCQMAMLLLHWLVEPGPKSSLPDLVEMAVRYHAVALTHLGRSKTLVNFPNCSNC